MKNFAGLVNIAQNVLFLTGIFYARTTHSDSDILDFNDFLFFTDLFFIDELLNE